MEIVDNMHKQTGNCDTVICIKTYTFLFPSAGTEFLKLWRLLSDKR